MNTLAAAPATNWRRVKRRRHIALAFRMAASSPGYFCAADSCVICLQGATQPVASQADRARDCALQAE